jgi:hypothetical protein
MSGAQEPGKIGQYDPTVDKYKKTRMHSAPPLKRLIILREARSLVMHLCKLYRTVCTDAPPSWYSLYQQLIKEEWYRRTDLVVSHQSAFHPIGGSTEAMQIQSPYDILTAMTVDEGLDT